MLSPSVSNTCALLEAHGVALDAARHMLYFRLAADADQFLTMAKVRALAQIMGAR